MKPEMIFFDMGGTIDLYPNNEKCVADACAKMKIILEESGAEQISGLSEREFRETVLKGLKKYTSWRTVDFIELSPEKLFSEFILEGYGVDDGIINSVAEDLAFLIDTGFFNRYPRPEAAEVLNAIRDKGIRMGIISNVMSRGQVGYCLDKYGLSEFFDPVVLSSVFGKRKPHPDIFHHACELAGVSPSDIIYVGNSLIKDIGGAQKAGVGVTVFIDYFENSPDDKGPVPDYSIKDLRELLPVLESVR
ncbi:MAG: HAD family hydrolase [Spirochaetia bacterium]|jgi:FMN phosphatase YigB (HAD superfamily)|nr:HAD family hydrolase [Spirochaetia bacterium]